MWSPSFLYTGQGWLKLNYSVMNQCSPSIVPIMETKEYKMSKCEVCNGKFLEGLIKGNADTVWSHKRLKSGQLKVEI